MVKGHVDELEQLPGVEAQSRCNKINLRFYRLCVTALRLTHLSPESVSNIFKTLYTFTLKEN